MNTQKNESIYQILLKRVKRFVEFYIIPFLIISIFSALFIKVEIYIFTSLGIMFILLNLWARARCDYTELCESVYNLDKALNLREKIKEQLDYNNSNKFIDEDDESKIIRAICVAKEEQEKLRKGFQKISIEDIDLSTDNRFKNKI